MRTNARLPGIDDGMPEPPPKPTRAPLYICHNENGTAINQRRDDGYIDATAMCRAYRKAWSHYRENKQTTEFLAYAESALGIPIALLIDTRETGRYSERGTWVHPRIAIHCAQWVSPEFAFLVTGWVFDWMQGRQPTISTEPFVIGKICDALQRLDKRTEQMADALDWMKLPLMQAAYGRDATCVKREAAKAPGSSEPRPSATYVDPETGEVRVIPPLAEPRKG